MDHCVTNEDILSSPFDTLSRMDALDVTVKRRNYYNGSKLQDYHFYPHSWISSLSQKHQERQQQLTDHSPTITKTPTISPSSSTLSITSSMCAVHDHQERDKDEQQQQFTFDENKDDCSHEDSVPWRQPLFVVSHIDDYGKQQPGKPNHVAIEKTYQNSETEAKTAAMQEQAFRYQTQRQPRHRRKVKSERILSMTVVGQHKRSSSSTDIGLLDEVAMLKAAYRSHYHRKTPLPPLEIEIPIMQNDRGDDTILSTSIPIEVHFGSYENPCFENAEDDVSEVTYLDKNDIDFDNGSTAPSMDYFLVDNHDKLAIREELTCSTGKIENYVNLPTHKHDVDETCDEVFSIDDREKDHAENDELDEEDFHDEEGHHNTSMPEENSLLLMSLSSGNFRQCSSIVHNPRWGIMTATLDDGGNNKSNVKKLYPNTNSKQYTKRATP